MYGITDLEAFVEIVERGGVTAAAANLGLSPATVSHRLTKLERHLGAQLFYRDSRHFRPSPEGETFYGRITPLLESLRDAEQAVAAEDTPLSGRLRVTLPPWILAKYVLPNFARFADRHPDLKSDFLATDRFVNLQEEGLDAAVRVGQLEDSSLRARKIAENRRTLCASPAYLERHGRPERPEDLIGHLWVCLPWQTHWRLRMSDGTHKNITGRRQITLSNSDSLTEAAVNGLGITIKSRLAIAGELAAGRLEALLPGVLEDSEAPIWLLRAPQGIRSRKIGAFYDFMAEVFAKSAPGPS